ncbi:MAG TPA: CNNM domain-containing protein, partial [Planctomycetota bacterium]|nr:CNNM domain-containing protein [Planctomycetota bacterium]
MTLLLAAAAVILLMFLSSLCSGMETGFYALDRVRLQLRAEEGDGRARRLLVAAARPAVAVCALLLANNVVNYFVSDAASALLDGVAPSSGGVLRQVLDTLAVTPFLFVLGDLAPKDAFLRAPTRLMLRFEPFFRLILAAFGPAAAPFLWLGRKIGGEGAGLAREETVFERAALGRLLTEEEEVAGLSPAQRDFAKRVLRLRTVRVADRMTPVKAVAAVRLDARASEIAALGAAVKRSRLPVWAPGGRIFAGY